MIAKGLIAGAGIAIVLIACSSPDVGDTPKLETPKPSSPSASTKKDAGTSGSDSSSSVPTTPTAKTKCAAETESIACWNCCQEENPFTADIYSPVLDCQCDACKTECADTFCNEIHIQPEPGDACDTCMKTNEKKCNAKADDACAKDAQCAKFAACGKTAGCEGKK